MHEDTQKDIHTHAPRGSKTPLVVGTVVIVLIILGLVVVAYHNRIKDTDPTSPTNEGETAIDAENEAIGFDDEVSTVTDELPDAPIPDLDRVVVFKDTVPERIQTQTQELIEGYIAVLSNDPGNFNTWMDLALQRNGIEDFEGARDAWEYASLLRPGNSLSFANLGFLYGYRESVRDLKKAEENFLQAISNSPAIMLYYSQAFDFYEDIAKDPEKARGIIELGIENNPDNEDLKAFLHPVK